MFSKVKKSSKEEAKQVILREFFNSSEQKKAVTRAARESAKDQLAILEKYQELKLNKICR
ncbi:MAG: hypothetical protein WC238_05305 [Parcubacteria group bacterium]